MKIVFYIIVILVLVVIIKNLTGSVIDNIQGKSIITSYQSTLSQRKKEHEFLKEQLSYVKSTRFVEEEARNKLGLVQNNEVVVIAPQPAKRKVLSEAKSEEPNWQQWVNLFR